MNITAILSHAVINGICAAIGISIAASIIIISLAFCRYLWVGGGPDHMQTFPPKVSLWRIIKWVAVLVVVAVAGRRVWDALGIPISAKIKEELGAIFPAKDE